MSKLQEAAHINSEGISALRDGDHAYAAQLFPQSIQILKAELLRITPKQTDTADLQYDDSDIRLLQEKTKTVEILTSSQDCSDSTIVFNRAITMPADVDAEDLKAYEFCLHMYTTVAIYNLALSHHLMASSGASGSEKMLIKVEKLYEIVLRLLMDGSALLNMHTGLLIKLACINNLSQIRYFKHEDESERRAELLSHVAFFMQRSASSNQAVFEDLQDMGEEDHMQGLLKNAILLLHEGGPRRSAAAA